MIARDSELAAQREATPFPLGDTRGVGPPAFSLPYRLPCSRTGSRALSFLLTRYLIYYIISMYL